MRRRPTFVPPELTGRARRVYLAVTAWFVVVFLAMLWPVYPHFSRIRPTILGVPLSLAYLVALLVLSFLVLLGLHLWEERRDGGRGPGAAGSDGDGSASTEGTG